MERTRQYQMLTDGDLSAQPVPMMVVLPPAPPEYSQTAASVGSVTLNLNPPDDGIPPPKADFHAPPAYDVATELPSYAEVQRQKVVEEQLRQNEETRPTRHTFLALETDAPMESGRPDIVLGTDFIFFSSFFVAFVFNWIGFLLLMCFCHSVAGRYGALAGFGLSLVKWTLIVKHSTDLVSHDNSWLWWLIMAFGLLICVRAVIQYLCIKREWHRLSRNAQERVIFFY